MSGIVSRPRVEGIKQERAHLTRLERAQPAYLPGDIECELRIGLRRMIAVHGDSQPCGDSSGASRIPYRANLGKTGRSIGGTTRGETLSRDQCFRATNLELGSTPSRRPAAPRRGVTLRSSEAASILRSRSHAKDVTTAAREFIAGRRDPAASEAHEPADQDSRYSGRRDSHRRIDRCRVLVNVTRLFSWEQHLTAAVAYMRGVERRIVAGLDPRVGSCSPRRDGRRSRRPARHHNAFSGQARAPRIPALRRAVRRGSRGARYHQHDP